MSKNNGDFFKVKKEWSETKDAILGCYLKPYFQKLLAFKKPMCYVDCFAGKGLFEDGGKGSPLIALDTIKEDLEVSRFPNVINCFFIELNYSNELRENISKGDYSALNIEVIGAKFEDTISDIMKKHAVDTVFLYVDPYGIKALDISQFNSFKVRDSKSVEMLINFNTWGFFREACRVYGASTDFYDKVRDYLVEYDPGENVGIKELDRIAGGNYWHSIVEKYRDGIMDFVECEKELAKGVANALENYDYVLNVPIKSSDDSRIPKYRLFHATNHPSGCVLMAENMYKRIEEANLRNKDGQGSIFDSTTEGEIVNDEDVKKLLLYQIDYKNERLYVILSKFYTENGILRNKSKLIDMIKALEHDGIIVIERNPLYSANGKPSSFMNEEKKNKVFIRKKASI